MTENGSRASKGNLMTVLRKILRELQEINSGIKELNGSKENHIEKETERFRNQNSAFRKG